MNTGLVTTVTVGNVCHASCTDCMTSVRLRGIVPSAVAHHCPEWKWFMNSTTAIATEKEKDLGTKFEKGDRVRVAAVEGTATYVTGAANRFGMDISLDDGRSVTVRDESLVEKVAIPAPAGGAIVEIDRRGRFLVRSDGKLTKLYSDGSTDDGFTWDYQSDGGKRKFTVLSEG